MSAAVTRLARWKIGSRSSARAGFTLVELLVTIGLLGALIGLTVPALSYARRRVHKMQCQANMREVGLLFQMYLDQPRNYQTFPNACRLPSVNSKDLPPLYVILDQSLKNSASNKTKNAEGRTLYHSNIQSLFHCPADEDYFPTQGLSYEYYQVELAGKKLKDVLTSRRSGRKRDPKYVSIMTEYGPFHGSDEDDPSPYAKTRHYLYLDWHVDDGVGPPEETGNTEETNPDRPVTNPDSPSSTDPNNSGTTNPPSSSSPTK
jgi:prepilin-type N-terminal cleavage/methylation domain-containing protein